MEIYTRTDYGNSNTYFSGQGDIPACGLGQGSKAAPMSWVGFSLPSSIFVRILRQKGFGAKLVDPVLSNLIHSINCLHVDDTDLYVLETSCIPRRGFFHDTAGNHTLVLSSVCYRWCNENRVEVLEHGGLYLHAWCLAIRQVLTVPFSFLFDGVETLVPQHAATDAVRHLVFFTVPRVAMLHICSIFDGKPWNG